MHGHQGRWSRARLGVRIGALAISVVAGLVACGGAPNGRAIRLPVQELNDSGVTGTLVLTPVAGDHTRIEVEVDPAGHPDMPAHIHPGTCAELTPQPKYALEDVVDGQSSTDVPAALEDLLADTLALNIHSSNLEMGVYAACVDI